MKRTHRSAFLLLAAVLSVLVLLSGCGGQSSAAAEKAYNDVISAEKITLEDALDLLKDQTFADTEQKDFVQMLEDLNRCSGGFVQTSEVNEDRYGATVEFYLVSGEVKCTVTYDNYMGEIDEGDVVKSSAKGYLFESEPKGDLFGREQEFHIWFGADALRISWADGTCDYTLSRGDGSAEGVKTAKTPFEETKAYKTIQETVENTYSDTPHSMVYDADTSTLTIYVQAPDGSSTGLRTNNEEVVSAWEGLVDKQVSLAEKMYTIAKVGGEVSTLDVIWVFRLDSGNQYTQDDYVLWVRNDELKYDYAMDGAATSGKTDGGTKDSSGSSTSSGTSSGQSSSSGGKSSGSSSSKGGASSGSSSGKSSTHAASFGEQNALKTAALYLDYTSFSYSGLIEQLEYEGYSHSEAVYAADNCGADWYEQAALKAAEYLDYMPFSRQELIEQLEYEGFSHAEAEHGASQNGY